MTPLPSLATEERHTAPSRLPPSAGSDSGFYLVAQNSQSLPEHTLNLRLAYWIFGASLAIFLLFTIVDLALSPIAFRDMQGGAVMGRSIASTISRAYNVIFGMVVSAIALAIPITANMYTPKLVEIFVTDRYTIGVLGFFVFSCSHAIWGSFVSWDGPSGTPGFWSRLNQYAILAEMLFGFAIMLPFLKYVSGFLNPSTIITKVSAEILAEFEEVERSKRPVREQQRRLNQTILHLGNVILRAVDRADRDVALEAIRATGRVVDRYDGIKSFLRPEWFSVGKDILSGLSSEAIQFVARDRSWVEYRCLTQLSLAFNAALTKMPDAVSAITETLRHMALECHRAGDLPVLRLMTRFLNTFLREAVKKKDVHALYDILHQYKALVRELLGAEPKVALECAQHFKYYAEFARASGLPFIYELTSYEVGEVVQWAYIRLSPVREELLALFLRFDGAHASARLAKARALLWAFFDVMKLSGEAERVRASLREVTLPTLVQARADLAFTTDPCFWEVTDRQTNFDYVDEERRRLVLSLLDGLLRDTAPVGASAGRPS